MTTTAYEAPTLDLDGLRDCSAHHNGTSYRLANALEAFIETLDPHDAEWVALAVNWYASDDRVKCETCDSDLRCRKCDDRCDDHYGPESVLRCRVCEDIAREDAGVPTVETNALPSQDTGGAGGYIVEVSSHGQPVRRVNVDGFEWTPDLLDADDDA